MKYITRRNRLTSYENTMSNLNSSVVHIMWWCCNQSTIVSNITVLIINEPILTVLIHITYVTSYIFTCRGIGRDILMFGASVVVIRAVMSALAEEMATPPAAPLPGIPGR